MANIIILVGPPRSGKTTLAKLMSDEPARLLNRRGVDRSTTYGNPGKTYILEGAVIDDREHHEFFKQMKRHRKSQYVVTTNVRPLPPWVYQYAQVWQLNPIMR